MEKFHYIETIIMKLRGTTGINFQSDLKHVLEVYYKNKGLNYSMPDFYGGDEKNDGWIRENATFY